MASRSDVEEIDVRRHQLPAQVRRVKKLLRFGIAGGLGFHRRCRHLTLLLHTTPLGPFLARLIAIALAMATTWVFNRTFTFGRSEPIRLPSEGFRYGSVGITAALVNYGLYSALLLTMPDLQPLAAMVFATAAIDVLQLLRLLALRLSARSIRPVSQPSFSLAR
jgi:putative flippase GtrA